SSSRIGKSRRWPPGVIRPGDHVARWLGRVNHQLGYMSQRGFGNLKGLENVRFGMVLWRLGMIPRASMTLREPLETMPRRHKPPRPPRTATTQAPAVYQTDLTDAQSQTLRPF